MKLEKFLVVVMPAEVTPDDFDHKEQIEAALRSNGYVVQSIRVDKTSVEEIMGSRPKEDPTVALMKKVDRGEVKGKERLKADGGGGL